MCQCFWQVVTGYSLLWSSSPHCTIGPHIQCSEIKMDHRSVAAISQVIQLIAKHALACRHLCISPFSWTQISIPIHNTFHCLSKVEHLELFKTQCGSPKELIIIISCFPKLLSLTLRNDTFHRMCSTHHHTAA